MPSLGGAYRARYAVGTSYGGKSALGTNSGVPNTTIQGRTARKLAGEYCFGKYFVCNKHSLLHSMIRNAEMISMQNDLYGDIFIQLS